MQVILKPGGVALLLVALGLLSWVALGRGNGNIPARSAAAPSPAPSPTATPLPVGQVSNGGFEEPSALVRQFGDPKTSKATVSGALAQGWFDNSDWADVTVAYSADPQSPHGGAVSQRVEVRETRDGHAQMGQPLDLEGSETYRVSLYLKASRPTRVESFYREFSGNATLGSETFAVGTDWKRMTLTVDPRERGSGTVHGLLLLALRDAGVTLWLDDVTIEATQPLPAGKQP